MFKSNFDEIWRRIEANQGEKFFTIGRLDFTYKIVGNGRYLVTSRTRYKIPKSDFEKAFSMVPIPNTTIINKIVRGPSYIWAILHDPKISQGEW